MVYKRGEKWHMDATVSGVRYREALDTTDKREALALEKKRIGEIQNGKRASISGREFARLPFDKAADKFLESRKDHVAVRTAQLDRERLRPLRSFFGEKPLIRIHAEHITSYQQARLNGQISFGNKPSICVAARTVNMEVGVLRQVLNRAKLWRVVEEDVKMLPEKKGVVGRVLTKEQKILLFAVAGSQDRWLVAYCAAVLAATTTCRGVELKNLRWQDVDLFGRRLTIRRSKTEAGLREIPLMPDAIAALGRLLARAVDLNSNGSEHFVFPACERGHIDPTKSQVSWRTAWRNLVTAAAKRAGKDAAEEAGTTGGDAHAASTAAMAAFTGLRFHDLRHQAITELAEAGAPDATLMSISGHMSVHMLRHYSHVRMAAKRDVLEKLDGGLMTAPKLEPKSLSERPN